MCKGRSIPINPTDHHRRTLLFVGVLSMLLSLISISTSPAQGPWRDSFESIEPSFKDAGGDTIYRLRVQKSQSEVHSGDWCDHVTLQAGHGSYVYVSHAIRPTQIIEELRPTIWVKASRPGVQMVARAVLPQTIDPQTQLPATVLLRGMSYTETGHWQQLALDRPRHLLDQQLRGLQLRLGESQQIDARLAYLDTIFINVYAGQGASDILLDDLELAGFVPRSGISPITTVSNTEVSTVSTNDPAIVQLRGDVLQIDQQPQFIRGIRHRGESLRFLKQVGFNTILLDAPPGANLLAEAEELGLWLICPPPLRAPRQGTTATISAISTAYDRVVAWDLGRSYLDSQKDSFQRQMRKVRDADRSLSRPLLAGAIESLKSYSRLADILVADRIPFGTPLELSHYCQYHRGFIQQSLPGTPIWTSLPTEYDPAILEQWRLLSPLLPTSPLLSPEIPGEMVRLYAFAAVAAGSRGLLFESQNRLDQDSPSTKNQLKCLTLLNRELELIAPWVATGEWMGYLTTSHPQVTAAQLTLRHADLVIAHDTSAHSQYVLGQASVNNLKLVVPGVSESREAYLLASSGVQRLRKERVPGGVQILLPEFDTEAMVLLTRDPSVYQQTRLKIDRLQPEVAGLWSEIAKFKATEYRDAGKVNPQPPTNWRQAWQAWRTQQPEIERFLSLQQTNLKEGQFGESIRNGKRAMRRMRIVSSLRWEETVQTLDSPACSPWALSDRYLNEHLSAMDEWTAAPWGQNLLPEGDCEQLSRLTASGWSPFYRSIPQVQSFAELASAEPRSTGSALRLVVQPEPDVTPPSIDSPPLWVATRHIMAAPGQILKISLWSRQQSWQAPSSEGLFLYDSVAGQSLGIRLAKTMEWEKTTLFRAVPHQGNFSLTFVVNGYGEFLIDDLEVTAITPPQASPDPRFSRNPRPSTSTFLPNNR
ncbi:Hypothetical protein PBC10988_38770 [Planctomycetales bacterium 10988]|nr:Hypothetical protein PBC10988_38770 [Planctomycetales bacterium 10988]